jgi:hypothetical protein
VYSTHFPSERSILTLDASQEQCKSASGLAAEGRWP